MTSSFREHDDIDHWVHVVVDSSTPGEADDAVNEIASICGRAMAEDPFRAAAYLMWTAIEDLFSDAMRTGVPEAGAWELSRQVAATWSATPAEQLPELVEGALDRDLVEAVRLLGYQFRTPDPRLDIPWLGRWELARRIQADMDLTHRPYACAQRLLHITSNEARLRVAAGCDHLERLMCQWDDERDRRDAIDDDTRSHIAALRAEDVPPITS